MANEKVARIATAEIVFTPEKDESESIILGHQQSITLSKSSDKKELLSNDVQIDGTAEEIETKINYTIKTEIADLSLDILSLCFKGSIEEKTYKVGDKFITGKTIVAKTAQANAGVPIIDGDKIYIAKEDIAAGSFNADKCAAKTYPKTIKQIRPETRGHNYGSLEIKGKNVVTGDDQILIIPRVNLSFTGDLAVSGNDFAKVSLEGKILQTKDAPLFTFLDA